MPWLGLGVYKTQEGAQVEQAIADALEAGYRSIDTAAAYGNEEGVGRAIAASGLKREELFITTKVWNSNQGYESTLKAFEDSRQKLQLDVIDLYLVHWPVAGKYKDTYRALEKLYKDGHVRAIGVSNFLIPHLEDLLGSCEIVPAVNQVEFQPFLTQPELQSYCKDRNIQLEAWSPLLQGHLDVPLLQEIGHKHGKSVAQVILRWDLQNGIVTIPKSVTKSRIIENADIFNFELTTEEMEAIDGLNENRRLGSDPMNFNF
ncbi:aldo/keto reductase [Paenibacillus lupini]|uniref:aldo/keto reductase n=1 Tax=Paenibacillus lupini TaxID=1450204 RepID=UPI001423E553|nr:aldo/keto reductase [Paenibacillus lupini]